MRFRGPQPPRDTQRTAGSRSPTHRE
jgi:hypothetical protein